MNGRTNKYLIALALLMLLPQPLLAESLWSDVPDADENPSAAAASAVSISAAQPDPHKNSRRVSVRYDQLKTALANAETLPTGQLAKSPATVQFDLPMPDGDLQTFNVYESSVMAAELAARYPQIKTYKAIAVSDAGIRGVLNLGPNGFRGYLFTPGGEVFIDPVPDSDQQYYSYYKHNYVSTASREFSCGVKTESDTQSPVEEFKTTELVTAARTSTGDKISYRIAVAATGEYSQKVGGGIVANTLAEINTAISRINEIYERDLAIKLILVDNNDRIIYTDASGDPYNAPTNASLLLEENQTNLDKVLGSSAYDIGHVLSTSGGGLAGLGVACRPDYKARGASGDTDPSRDPFYIDILAHEIGHQLGANHSFNGTTESCANNRNAATAFEPGSGSTIMAYAGICGVEDVRQNSDVTFHAGSIAEIVNYTRIGLGKSCADPITGSNAPLANAGLDYAIPGGTAFVLTGSATDPENDLMTFQWDQMDTGDATDDTTYGTDLGNNALFRSFKPVATPVRIFPQLTTQLSNTPDKAETLPIENRILNFRFTARDGNGGVDEDDMQIAVNANTGPFKVLQPNTSVTLNSAQLQSIQWNAACSEQLPVSCANVDILLSTDGGTIFSSLVGGTTFNDGVEIVSLPNSITNNARIKIACTNNIFFDISDVDFAIGAIGGGSLPTDIIGGSYDCGTATIIPSPPPSSGGGGTLNVYWLLLLLFTPLLRFARPLVLRK
ncbi:MAG: M12 family metallo-peptidase [Gammaproteobacteria bacterium]|nr:M12 family metallo-peptidase [Gammaproteobacteria bacterium]